MEATASGTFEVTLKPVAGADPSIGSLSIQKSFQGDLQGGSVGQMLAIRTPRENSAGYVAMERVTATLAGRHGTFALQHSGTMDRGAQSASVTVVPDSATDGLSGLTGTMKITIPEGKHHYVFAYTLPDK